MLRLWSSLWLSPPYQNSYVYSFYRNFNDCFPARQLKLLLKHAVIFSLSSLLFFFFFLHRLVLSHFILLPYTWLLLFCLLFFMAFCSPFLSSFLVGFFILFVISVCHSTCINFYSVRIFLYLSIFYIY